MKGGRITGALLPTKDVLYLDPGQKGTSLKEDSPTVCHRRLRVGHHWLWKLERSLLFFNDQCLKLMYKYCIFFSWNTDAQVFLSTPGVNSSRLRSIS